MRRGQIRLVDFDPAQGSEANKRRPAVIVSNDGANTTAERLGRGVVTVVPVTSNTEACVPVPGIAAGGETWSGPQLEGTGRTGSLGERRADQ